MAPRGRPGHMKRIAIAVALLALASGCAGVGGSPTPVPVDPEGSWRLVEGHTAAGAVPLVDDHPITITIAGSEVSGTAACNGYGGRLEPAPGGITLAELGMTAMACVPDEVMRSEEAYIEALSAVRSLHSEGDELVLEGPDVELRFARLAPLPTSDLVGTAWQLETLLVGDVASAAMGEPASLRLRADGTFEGGTGCRTFTGTWIEDGHQILATELFMDDLECPAALRAQDGHVVSVLGDGFVPAIEEGRLTLMDRGGVGLVYRATE